MASAATRTLETYELLENIIGSIDEPRSIFVLQRVNKAWRTIIQRSTTVQRKVFETSTRPPVRPVSKKAVAGSSGLVYDQRPTMNDVLPMISIDTRAFSRSSKLMELSHVVSLDFFGKNAANQIQPSYHKLFLTEPPITTAYVVVHGESWNEAQDLEGVKLGQLADVADNMFAGSRGGRRGFDVDAFVSFTTPRTE